MGIISCIFLSIHRSSPYPFPSIRPPILDLFRSKMYHPPATYPSLYPQCIQIKKCSPLSIIHPSIHPSTPYLFGSKVCTFSPPTPPPIHPRILTYSDENMYPTPPLGIHLHISHPFRSKMCFPCHVRIYPSATHSDYISPFEGAGVLGSYVFRACGSPT